MHGQFLLRLLSGTIPSGEHVPDAELLRKFTQERDTAAIELLIRRHANAVWTACRRVLASDADAEDAFQATFLVLARKAGAIRGACVGGWLHRVAVNAALKLREHSHRIASAPAEQLAEVAAPDSNDPDMDLSAAVQEELARLPERYRLPVVLCELEGHTHAEAASLLGWPVGSVSGRLSRARTLLRDRLSRRGLSKPAVMLPALGAPSAVVRNAVAVIAGTVPVLPTVSTLTTGVLLMMRLAKGKLIAAWLMTIGLIVFAGFGAYVAMGQRPADDDKGKPMKPVEPQPRDKSADMKTDRKEDAAALELKVFQGEWKVVWLESGRKKRTAKEMEGMRWTFKGNQIDGANAGQKPQNLGEFKLDPGKDPKQIDLLVTEGNDKGTTLTGIYKLEDGRLTISLKDVMRLEAAMAKVGVGIRPTDKGRPTDFTADPWERDGLVLVVLESLTAPPKRAAKPAPAPEDTEADLMQDKRWAVRSNDTLELVGPGGVEGTPVKLPRFRFEPGQELVYTGGTEIGSDDQGYELGERNELRIWVVRLNEDGSWSLVMRSTEGGPLHISFDRCELFPDGRIVESPDSDLNGSMRSLLPRLPADAAEAAKGWAAKAKRKNETFRYRLVPPTKAGRCSLEAVCENLLCPASGITVKTVIAWDTDRGLPETIRSAISYVDKRRERGALKLREVKSHDLRWSRAFAADAERFFAAKASYDRVLTGLKLSAAPAELKKSLEKAKADLTAAQQYLEQPEFRQQVETTLTMHEELVRSVVEEAERQRALLGQPAADWSTTDLEGKSHALKDYAGKVVILDFWYCSCIPCLQTMPQIKEIAARFKDQPVIVLGMNTDAKEEDARLVAQKMELNYPTLKAAGLPEKYKVKSFPTLIIIDQEGIVRDIQIGCSATLKDDVVKSVERLLKAKP